MFAGRHGGRGDSAKRALSATMAGNDVKKSTHVDDIMNLGGGGAFSAALTAPVLAPPSADGGLVWQNAGTAPSLGLATSLAAAPDGGYVLATGQGIDVRPAGSVTRTTRRRSSPPGSSPPRTVPRTPTAPRRS